MKAVEGTTGRIFVITLEDGDPLPASIENLAAEKGIKAGFALAVGGVNKGDIVVGPRDSAVRPPEPMTHHIEGAHEICAFGVLAPNSEGKPVLHMHGSMGRSEHTVAGCLRQGAQAWLTCEVILYEIIGAEVVRAFDSAAGLTLLKSTADAASSIPISAPVTPSRPAAQTATETKNTSAKASSVLHLFNAQLS